MAKNSKRRRNGKLKKRSKIQPVLLNHEISVEKVEVCKTIFKKDTVNLPKRKDYTTDKEGKRLFKEARRLFWESHTPIKKEIKRTRKVVKRQLNPELIALQRSDKRSKDLELICSTSVVQGGNASRDGKCISFVDEKGGMVRNRPIVVSSYELHKAARLVRFINHGSQKKTNYQLRRLKSAA